MSSSTEYNSWFAMKQRCYNENATGYKYCGGKGVKVCPEWISDFTRFLQDMGPRPDGAYLQRKDRDKDFDKENCYWSLEKKARQPRVHDFGDQKMTIREIMKLTGASYHRIYYHIRKGHNLAAELNYGG